MKYALCFALACFIDAVKQKFQHSESNFCSQKVQAVRSKLPSTHLHPKTDLGSESRWWCNKSLR